MSHRIEVELTSTASDGTWTWRAAGAKQPRGTVPGALVPVGASVGSVLRADIESGLDGMTILTLAPPKRKAEPKAVERIELIGPPKGGPDVNVILAGKGRSSRPDRRDSGPGRSRTPRGETTPGAPRPAAGTRPGPDERRGRSSAGSTRSAGPSSGGPHGGAGRGVRPGGPTGPGGDRGIGPGAGRERPAGSGRRDGGRRLPTSTTYRNAALASLKPEELPVAEQLLRGGIPAVRAAIDEQNARARSDGRAEVNPVPLIAMAEALRPVVNLATWKDRAAAARVAGKDVPLRELRSIAASASTVILDEEGREFAAAIRAALDQRVKALRDDWVRRISSALDSDRVADALRTASRPPEPGTRLSAELAVSLAQRAGAAMAADTPAALWAELLDAVVDSPVRRTVKPAGLPAEMSEELTAAARKAAGYVPALAGLLGIPIPPPPGPRRPAAQGGGSGSRR